MTNIPSMGLAMPFTVKQEGIINNFPSDEQGFVSLGEICFNFLNEQTQYVSRHLLPDFEAPFLADGLRVVGEDEYDLMIHRDDVRTFIVRLLACRV